MLIDEIVLDDEQIRDWARQRFPVNEFTRIERVYGTDNTVFLSLIDGQRAIPYENIGEMWYETINLSYSSFTLYTPEGLMQVRAEFAPQTNVLVYKLVPWPVAE